MTEYKNIIVEEGQYTTVTLNRPDRLNAFSPGLLDELFDAVNQIAVGNVDTRALLITGAGRGFCAGADLAGGDTARADTGASLMKNYHPLALEISNLPVPVITAVNGVAAGAGMSLAINADFVLAAESAYFLQAFVNIGLVPDMGSSYWLPRLVGPQRARRMMMLGERIPAKTAVDWGLAYEVYADDALLPAAHGLATRLSEGPTQSYIGIRDLMRSTFNNTYEGQLQAEAMVQRRVQRSHDATEGIDAFVEKRQARFTGK